MRASQVSAVHGASRWLLRVKGTLLGKVAGAARRQRRAPRQALRAWQHARSDGPPPAGRGRFRIVYVVLCGPGDLAAACDLVDSIRAYEGDGAKVLMVDDATTNCRWTQVAAHDPAVDVLRLRWPTGGPPPQSRALNRALRAALRRYEFDVLCKLDTDALVTGPRLSEAAAQRFIAEPRIGQLGTTDLRADGVQEDHSYDAWVLAHERRWSRAVRDRVARARSQGFDGRKAHGGVYVLSRAALEVIAANGDLDQAPPRWSLINEDLWMSLAVWAAGFELGSWGAPGEPTASASKWLPVPLAEVGTRGLLAVHSVRRGADGESEAEVRAALRAQRAGVDARGAGDHPLDTE